MIIRNKVFQKQVNLWGWILIAPTIIGILLFIVYPVVFSVILSFTNWKFIFVNVKFLGFENYAWIFSSSGSLFWDSLWISIKFTFISTAIQTFLGFLLAYVLYNMSKKVQGVYKILLYIPVILPAAVISVMWVFIYEPNVGLIARLFPAWENIPIWLADERYALGAVIFTNTWRYIGFTMIIYFVAMNAIPKDVIESASIDGAGRTRILWRIIFPLTWSSTQVNLLLSIMGGLKSFDLFFLFSGGKGDYGLRVVGLYIYQTAFVFKTFARAVAMSIVLSVIIGGITIVINKLMNKQEEKINE